MAKIPFLPHDIFIPLMQYKLQAFGIDLVSLMLYGSAAGGAYVKGKSDINVLVVLTPAGMNRLDQALPLVGNWRKRNVAVPLVMTRVFMESSLDSYPIEFLNMKNNSILIYGENLLETLIFKPKDLRLQIERELKSKILLLREGYLESEGQARPIRHLIGKSLTAFVAIFNALLYLKTGVAPHDKRATIGEMSKVFGLNADVFASCFSIKEGTDKLSSAEVIAVFKKYLSEAEQVCHRVDGL